MRTADKHSKPVIFIFGPTAVGKTDLLTALCSDNNLPVAIEVINADSLQVYRHLDIGTAKPGEEIRKLLPHHLIDILDPREQFNVGMFVHRADKLVTTVLEKGRVPVISGGTAFYFKHFMFGLPETPPVDEAVRRTIADEAGRLGMAALYEKLRRIDPVSSKRLSLHDEYRITRALEVYEQTGKPLSHFTVRTTPRDSYLFLPLGLQLPRKELYRRINRRVDGMFDKGLIEEVSDLIERGYTESDPGMKGIGYREFFQMRREGCTTYRDIRERIQRDSRRYAKRQLTFFQKLPSVSWFHPEDGESIKTAIEGWISKVAGI